MTRAETENLLARERQIAKYAAQGFEMRQALRGDVEGVIRANAKDLQSPIVARVTINHRGEVV